MFASQVGNLKKREKKTATRGKQTDQNFWDGCVYFRNSAWERFITIPVFVTNLTRQGNSKRAHDCLRIIHFHLCHGDSSVMLDRHRKFKQTSGGINEWICCSKWLISWQILNMEYNMDEIPMGTWRCCNVALTPCAFWDATFFSCWCGSCLFYYIPFLDQACQGRRKTCCEGKSSFMG